MQTEYENQVFIDYDDLDETELPGLAAYRQLLTQAPAYKWLLSSLQAERILTTPGLMDTRSEIRNRIIDAFGRPKKFSRGECREVQM